jgi:hypothetical protein
MAARGLIRSLAEMKFSASLVPCPKCGAAPGRLDLYGSDGHYSLQGKCPSCGTLRQFDFDSDGDPLNRPHAALELGLGEPSQIIAPHQFLEELTRLEARITKPSTALSGAQWQAQYDDARRAATVILELCKFLPAGAARIPDAKLAPEDRTLATQHPEQYTRQWLEHERERILDRLEEFTADSPRIWRLGGKLRLVDEVRGLLNQVGRTASVDAASLRRYIERRGAPKADDDVGAISVREENGRSIAELAVRRGTLDDLEAAFSRVRRDGNHGTFEVKAAGQRVAVTVDLEGKNVKRLAIDFSPPMN